LTGECEPAFPALPRSGFNLKRYESHVQAHIQPVAVDWEQIPPLSKDARIDRVWRFIAIIFLPTPASLMSGRMATSSW
jgi:hypothetical protein